MPWIFGLVAIFAAIGWVQQLNDDQYASLKFLSVCVIVFFIAFQVQRYISNRREASRPNRIAARNQKLKEAAAKARAKALERAWLYGPPELMTPDALRIHVEETYKRNIPTPLRQEYLNNLLDHQAFDFSALTVDATKMSPADATEAQRIFIWCCVEGLLRFTKQVDQRLLQSDTLPAVLSTYVSHSHLLGQYVEKKDRHIWQFNSGQYAAFASLADPFNEQKANLANLLSLSEYSYALPDKPFANDFEHRSDYTRALKKYEEQCEEEFDRHEDYEKAMLHSPYWRHGYELLPTTGHHEPFRIPTEDRFSGTWIVAPPKRGKTTLLTSLFQEDLKLVAENKASIVVLDSKGELIDEIRHLKIFAPGQPMYGKLIIVDPDPDHPLALNPFDIEQDQPNLTTGERKMLANRSVTMLEYLFSTLLEAEATMSGPQQRFFRACTRAVLEVYPNPTIHTLYDLLLKGYEHPDHAPFIAKVEDQSFFTKDQFGSGTLKPTRESLLTRLGLLLDNYAIASMFKAEKSRLDLAKEMDSAKVIIINNRKALLEDQGAEFFGRFFLYQLRKAAERRPTKADHMPVFVYLDEAHNVIYRDENIATIIQECRSKNIAMVFAHQSISQIENDKVLSALGDCAIIMANSANEASQLAPRLHAESPEFLNRPVGNFAVYARDTADKAVSVFVAKPNQMLQMTEMDKFDITQEMRDKYCIPPKAPVPPTVTHPERQPDAALQERKKGR